MIYCFLIHILLPWPSWLRRRAYNAEIVGSNPTGSTLVPWRNWLARPTVNREAAGSSPAGTAFKTDCPSGLRRQT